MRFRGVATHAQDIWRNQPAFGPSVIRACSLSVRPDLCVLTVAADRAAEVWIEFPWHLPQCYGWHAGLPPCPPRLTDMKVNFRPQPEGVLMSATGLRDYVRDLLFLAGLRAPAQQEPAATCPVLFQQGTRDLDVVPVEASFTPLQALLASRLHHRLTHLFGAFLC